MKSTTKWVIMTLGWLTLMGLVVLYALHQGSRGDATTEPGGTVGAKQKTAVKSVKDDIQVPPPPFSDGIFPCSECHATQETNPYRRVLTDAHEDIIFTHDAENRWCLDCHDAKNRDMLHMADGRLVDFKESYKLCGQCHGLKLRDWRNGVHGRRTGSWNGQKQYLLCAHCHNPHAPKFKKLKPLPAPVKPENSK